MKAKLESEADCGMVLCADDPELLDKLSWAAEKGQSRDWIHTFSHVNFIVCCHILRPFKPYSNSFTGILTFCVAGLRVLLTRVERVVPCPKFLSRLMRTTGCVTPGITQCSQTTHPEFRLFLSTQLPVHLLGTGKDF